MSVNKATIIGRLAQDPELKYTQTGSAVVNFTLVTNEKYKTKTAGTVEEAQFHKCFAWGKTAELIGEYLSKGRETYIEGKIKNRSYEKDGIKRYVTEIEVQQVQFLGGKGDNNKTDDVPF
tara:strand:- start:144 stop:503 length:360 start_codon:yes stop_codon:yes gene_type:complete